MKYCREFHKKIPTRQHCVKKRHPLIHFNGTSVLMQQGYQFTGLQQLNTDKLNLDQFLPHCNAMSSGATRCQSKNVQTHIPGRLLCNYVFTQEPFQPLILHYASCVDTDTALKLLLMLRYAFPCRHEHHIFYCFP